MFGDLSLLIDAIMLVGGSLSEHPKRIGAPRLTIARGKAHWPQLFWLLTLLHRHGLRMRLRGVRRDHLAQLVFTSGASPLLADSFNRWHDAPGVAATPEMIQISADTMAIWLANAVACSTAAESSEIIRLSAPRLAEFPALYLQEQAASFGIATDVQPTSAGYFRLIVPAASRRDALGFLHKRVPPCVWQTELLPSSPDIDLAA